MVKKGKKKHHAQHQAAAAAAASTSTDPTPSTSEQQPSQEKLQEQTTWKKQKVRPQQQQKSQQEPQQSQEQQLQQPKELPKPQASGSRMQQPAPPQQESQICPGYAPVVTQRTQQRKQQRTQQQTQQRTQQQTQQQVSSPHMQQHTSQITQPQACVIPRGQTPLQQAPQQQAPQQQAWSIPRGQTPLQQAPQQQAPQQAWFIPRGQTPLQQAPQLAPQQQARSRPTLQPVPQPVPPPSAWSRPPSFKTTQQQQPLPQQFIPQQTQQQPRWAAPPQQPTIQPTHETDWFSHPSTSSQQVLGTDAPKEMQAVKVAQDRDKDIGKGDATRKMPTIVPSTSALTEEMSQLSMWEKKNKRMSEKDLNIPKRAIPNKAGTVGIPIRVCTNMFEIIFKDNFVTTAVHYDIKVVAIDNNTGGRTQRSEPRPRREIKNKTLLRQIFERWRQENCSDRHPAYDGMANVFAAREFSFRTTWFGEVTIKDTERDEDRTFEITMNKVGIIDLSWMKTMKPGLCGAEMNKTAIQILDIILRHAPASRLLNVGRSLFPAEGERVKALGGGLDLHVGAFVSAVIGWKPYLNVDVAHKAFMASANVIEIICEILCIPMESLDARVIYRNEDTVNKVLTGIKVNYAIPGQPSTKRTHRINGLGPNAIEHTFDVKGKLCSVKEYFATCKKYILKYPNLPCLWVGKRDGKIYLPVELCKVVPGQAINRKLDESQITHMIRYAATDTPTRIRKIHTALDRIRVNDSAVLRNEFNLEVSTKMKEVDARILPPPSLQYNDRYPATVNRGVWRAKKFTKPATLEDGTWTIANLCGANIDNKIPEFMQQLKNQANYFGMQIGKPKFPYPSVKPVQPIIEKFFLFMKDLKLIIVILPNRTDAVYGIVKKVSELRVGVLTQCIKMKNVVSPNNSTIQNILLKINSKLNGINHTFTQGGMPYCLRNKKYMLIGADVSHPSPDSRDIPSVAAVAASHDETSFKYNVTIRLQQPKQEEIADLKDIMIKHIEFYVKEMKTVPEIIIFYRDGVSEGQIGMVLEKEIKSIKDAFRHYARERKGFNPQLTFVIVQKRHHVRIFPINERDSDDRNFNVKAGTIVDTEITHPSHIDFYLVSHASIQGTARPTKYRCVCNESNFNEDQLEELTYYLCHMYARCTRSVSYPTPTYYAHLAAYRGRIWIQGDHYTETDFRDKNKCKLEPILQMPMSFV